MAAMPEPMPVTTTESGWQWKVLDGGWTYDLYESLPEDGNRYEVINGRLVMTPPPLIEHQRVGFRLGLQIGQWAVETGAGEVLSAPCAVVLTDAKQDYCEPDLLFVSKDRLPIITRKNIQGPPDLIVEVLSPGTRKKDLGEKFETYQRNAVSHYWVVDPSERYLLAYRLVDGKYRQVGRFGEKDVFEPEGFPGLKIDLVMVWVK